MKMRVLVCFVIAVLFTQRVTDLPVHGMNSLWSNSL